MVSVHTETLPRHVKELVVLSELYRHILYGGERVRPRDKHQWDDSGFEDEHIARMPMWKSYLYHLQTQAPKPKRIVCQREVPNRPPFYGREFHSAISREDTDFLLTIGGEGSYLIRESQRAPGQFTLAIRFDGVTKNFKLYYDGMHYVGEKRFDAIQDLVADGLITFYLESKAADYIADLSNQSNYAESPYVAYNTYKKKQLAAPRSMHRSHQRRTGDRPEPSLLPADRLDHRDVPNQRKDRSDRLEGENRERERVKRSEKTERSERVDRSPASNDPNRPNRRSAANLPIDSRISQIIENRQDTNHNLNLKKESQQSSQGTKTQGLDQSAQSDLTSRGQFNQSAIEHPKHGRAGEKAQTTPLADLSQHEYANQSQINLHRQQKEAQQRKASPKTSPHQQLRHSEPAVRNVTSDDSIPDGRVTSATNTDGPMLEDPHFTPPESPLMIHDDSKFSNVSWCAHYLQVLGSEKPHTFKQSTFKGPHWCDFCANFLWGLIAQGVKCQDCGFNAHKKCSEKVPNDCMPDMKYVKRIFGVDLTTLVKAQNTLIPVVVEKCVKEIEKRGIDSEGLYRVAGFHDDVEAIKMSFDKDGEMTDISEEKYDDLNTITSLLKLYFRLLPIPLITFDIYFQVIDTVRREDLSHDQLLESLRRDLHELPPAHYHTLKYLMSHLHRVAEKQSKNMMSAENLAIVYAPTLLRSPETDPLSGLTAVMYERELVELLIEHQSRLLD